MRKELAEFCVRLKSLNLSTIENALAILWFEDKRQPDVRMQPGKISKAIYESGLGNPNSTALGRSLAKSRLTIRGKSGFGLHHAARLEIADKLGEIADPAPPEVDQENGYIPKRVWLDTRKYVVRVCEQLNGCVERGFLDGASVLIRRLIETLLIEAYEKLGRADEIKGSDGNYLMLGQLVGRATGSNGISIGREAKKSLKQVKKLGDRSAHNRRYLATPADLLEVKSGVRVLTQELIHLAELH